MCISSSLWHYNSGLVGTDGGSGGFVKVGELGRAQKKQKSDKGRDTRERDLTYQIRSR